jgi:hypothetical protein
LVYQTAGQIAGVIKAAMDVRLEPLQVPLFTRTVSADGSEETNYGVAFDEQTETFTVSGGGGDVSAGSLQFVINTAVAPMEINVAVAEDDTAAKIAKKNSGVYSSRVEQIK